MFKSIKTLALAGMAVLVCAALLFSCKNLSDSSDSDFGTSGSSSTTETSTGAGHRPCRFSCVSGS